MADGQLRVNLARAVHGARPDAIVTLRNEPTNHLDFPTVLQKYLEAYDKMRSYGTVHLTQMLLLYFRDNYDMMRVADGARAGVRYLAPARKIELIGVKDIAKNKSENLVQYDRELGTLRSRTEQTAGTRRPAGTRAQGQAAAL